MARLRSSPVTRAALVLTLLVLGVVASGARADTKANCGRPPTGWSKVNLPKFSGGASYGGVTVSTSSSSQSWLVDPDDASVMLATDGGEIVRSDNAGCSWTTVFTVTGAFVGVDADPAASSWALPYYVAGLLVSPNARPDAPMYALLTPEAGIGLAGQFSTEPPLLVAVSTDEGRSWSLTMPDVTASKSIPHCDYLSWAAVSPADPHLLDVVCVFGIVDEESNVQQGYTNSSYGAYRSSDNGKTWTQFNLPTNWYGSAYGGGMMVADPVHSMGIWALASQYDFNSGATSLVIDHTSDGVHWSISKPIFTVLNNSIDYYHGMDIRRGPVPGSTRILVWAPVEGVVESTDGGRRWHRVGKASSAGGILRSTSPALTDASYLADGEVLTVGVYGPNCQKGSHTVVTRYRDGRSPAVRIPDPPKAWGDVFGSLTGLQSAGTSTVSIFGSVSTGSVNGPCGPSFLARYTSPG